MILLSAWHRTCNVVCPIQYYLILETWLRVLVFATLYANSWLWTKIKPALHLFTFQVLIDNEADVNVAGLTGYTPLHYAAREGEAEVAEVPLNSFPECSDDR